MLLDASASTFDSISVGDTLPMMVKVESQEAIDDFMRLAMAHQSRDPTWKDLHTDKAFASSGIFGGTVNAGPATFAYFSEVLERAFPLAAIFNGGRMEMRATQPIRAGDTVTLTGQVIGKRTENNQRLVDVDLLATNQRGDIVARARATVHF